MGKGQLLFKGEKAKKKNKNSKHSSKAKNSGIDHVDPSTAVPAVASRPQTTLASVPSAAPTMKQGTGKITTSGTVVTGYGTRFEKEINAGDAILCTLENGTDELRVVTMRLSNVSLNLSSAFSNNVKIPTGFQYIRKPRDTQKEHAEAYKKTAEALREQTTHAFDLYGSESLVYREKTETGSYRIKREQLSMSAAERSRGDLLEMRAKKTSDKFC
jgi:hypothetical protein